MEEITPEQLAKLMTRVQNLLNKADDIENRGTSLSGVVNKADIANEAAAFRSKAQQIMNEYRIAEESLIATDASVIIPVSRDVVISSIWTQFETDYFMLMYWIADHAGVQILTKRVGTDVVAELWGYEADIRLVEILWASARLTFGQNLEPKFNPEVSDQMNAYMLRRAGMLRKDVAVAVWGENTPANRSRAQRLYVKECQARGERPALEGMGTDAGSYRQAYATGFVSTVSDRLRAARDAANSSGGLPEFAGRADRIKEAMWTAHPRLRPVPRDPETIPVKRKEAKPWKPTKADMKRWARQNGPAARAGRMAGGDAAQAVEIQSTTAPESRLGV